MNQSPKAGQQGPDPAIGEAIHTLNRSELSPLEETMFQAWATANQLEDTDSPENTMDFRQVYQQTGGKVMPPGELKRKAEKMSAIQTLMQAQEAHDSSSPMKLMMDARAKQEQPITGDADPFGGVDSPEFPSNPQAGPGF